LQAQSALPGSNIFFFRFIPSGTTITLELDETGGGCFFIALFNGTTFVNGYTVSFTGTPTRSGAAITPCSFAEAGQTAGAVFADPVFGSSIFDSGTAVATPEPASLLLFGTAARLADGLFPITCCHCF
jgi:hypothetical protein